MGGPPIKARHVARVTTTPLKCQKKCTFADAYPILSLALKNNGGLRPHGAPFFGRLSWSLSPMASIERTAYPRFKPSLTASERHALDCPPDDERAFIATHARGEAQQLTLLTLLTCQQHLGDLPPLAEVPAYIRTYLCQQLHLFTVDVHTRRSGKDAVPLSSAHSHLLGYQTSWRRWAKRGRNRRTARRLYHERSR